MSNGRRGIARCAESAPRRRQRAAPRSVRATTRPTWVMSQACFGELRGGVWVVSNALGVKVDPTAIAAVDRINRERMNGRTS